MGYSDAFRVRCWGAGSDAGQFQQDPGQPFLAVIEKLVAKILFQVDSACEQRSYEFTAKLRLDVHSAEHGCFLDVALLHGGEAAMLLILPAMIEEGSNSSRMGKTSVGATWAPAATAKTSATSALMPMMNALPHNL